jgi:hypothetical protein
MNAHEIEARLNAHREVLISLMASMMADGRHAAVFDELQQDAVFRDGEEDPGIVPSKAFASEAHAADEIARLLEAARSRAAAAG